MRGSGRTGYRGSLLLVGMAIIIATVLAVVLSAAPAVAAPSAVLDQTVDVGSEDPCAGPTSGEYWLPVYRWADGSSVVMGRSSGFLAAVSSLLQDLFVDASFGGSAMVWKLNADLTTTATRFCPMDSYGGAMDKAVAALYAALISSDTGPGVAGLGAAVPLLGVLVIVGVVGVLLARRGQQSPRWLPVVLSMLLMVGVVWVMSGQAGKSEGGVGDGSVYRPAVGSPGWVVSAVSDAASRGAAARVGGLDGGVSGVGAPWGGWGVVEGPDDPGDPFTCAAYGEALEAQYRDTWRGWTGRVDASGPVGLSQVWESSSLQAWRAVQFRGSLYGDWVWCRLLDSYATDATTHMSAATVLGVTGTDADGSTGVVSAAFAWIPLAESNWQARAAQMVLWAGCQPSGEEDGYPWDGDFVWRDVGLLPEAVAGEDATGVCQRFFLEDMRLTAGVPATTFAGVGLTGEITEHLVEAEENTWWEGFVPPEDDEVFAEQVAGHPHAAVFLGALIHEGGWSDWASGGVLLVAALACLVGFGLLSGGVLVGKLILTVMTVTLVLEVVVGVAKRDPGEAARKWGFRLVGTAFYTAMMAFMFSLVRLFSSVAIGLARVFPGGASGFLAVLVSGFAPLFGIWLLVKMLKRLGLANPFSLTGAMAYGKAVSALGARVAPGEDGVERGLNRMGQVARRRGARLVASGARTLTSGVGTGVGSRLASYLLGRKKPEDDPATPQGADSTQSDGKRSGDTIPQPKPQNASDADSGPARGIPTPTPVKSDGEDEEKQAPDEATPGTPQPGAKPSEPGSEGESGPKADGNRVIPGPRARRTGVRRVLGGAWDATARPRKWAAARMKNAARTLVPSTAGEAARRAMITYGAGAVLFSPLAPVAATLVPFAVPVAAAGALFAGAKALGARVGKLTWADARKVRDKAAHVYQVAEQNVAMWDEATRGNQGADTTDTPPVQGTTEPPADTPEGHEPQPTTSVPPVPPPPGSPGGQGDPRTAPPQSSTYPMPPAPEGSQG